MSEDGRFDPENPEWTADDFDKARPTADVLGQTVADLLTRPRTAKPSLADCIARQQAWLTSHRLAA
ncbi:hypothetical protein [Blastomonas sp.]|uniref:hypothetical protein n=1 Tax=Blastomonas sp. TaxID=1909299 RepID=UPI00406A0B3C